jgi:tetrahydrodipicolinate N-succinyltransferase
MRVRVMVFNAIFNNIFAISWQSVLLVEETGVPGETLQTAVSQLHNESHNVVSSRTQHEQQTNKQTNNTIISGFLSKITKFPVGRTLSMHVRFVLIHKVYIRSVGNIGQLRMFYIVVYVFEKVS